MADVKWIFNDFNLVIFLNHTDPCQPGEIDFCYDGTCIPEDAVCDGYFNCPDFTDEIFCPRKLLFATIICFICLMLFVLLLLLSSALGIFIGSNSYLIAGITLMLHSDFIALHGSMYAIVRYCNNFVLLPIFVNIMCLAMQSN